MRKKAILLILLVILTAFGANLGSLLSPLQAEAKGGNSQLEIIRKGLTDAASRAGYSTKNINFAVVIGGFVRAILVFLGVIFMVILIWGGIMWMTAGGNEEKITHAKKILVNAVIGLIIIFISWALTTFAVEQILTATQSQLQQGQSKN